jgi:CRP-like cAMP-binding protein
MSFIQAASVSNRLLAALPDTDRQHLLSGCEQVELVLGNILSEPGNTIHHVYFPLNSFISLVMSIDGGAALEVGLVGNEGMLGIPLILGIDIAPFHALVLGAGPALRITASKFLHELELSPALQRELKRYLYVTISQLAQIAACSRFHLIEQRLARWLLMTRDRAHSDEFHITQEFLAQMLGVRRVGITKAAGILQKNKLISYSRGDVKILDIHGLEAAACSCYQADKEIYDRILT